MNLRQHWQVLASVNARLNAASSELGLGKTTRHFYKFSAQ
jgi:hypothetical protein